MGLALDLDPDCDQAHVGKGQVLYERNDFELARQVFEQVLEKWPDQVTAHKRLGTILHQNGETREAIPHWELVLQKFPNERIIRNQVGKACKRFGMVQGALHHYKQAVLVDPDFDWWFSQDDKSSCDDETALRTTVEASRRVKVGA